MRAFLLLLAASTALFAQTPQAKPAAAAKPKPPRDYQSGWVQLFNGKDLTNWVKVGNESWTVEDGVIHGRGITKEYGYLMTEKKYKDFEMSFRFKCEADGNSGVFVHAEFEPGTPKITQGVQFEIDRTPNHHTGGLYGDGRQWFAWPSPENEFVIKPNDWNDMTIRVDGNRYWCRLNGVVVLDFTDPTPKSFDGHVALQLHSGGLGDMKFKDLFIRDFSRR